MIVLKSDKEIEVMHQGGKKLARVMRHLERAIKPGVTTRELERLACSLIERAGGRPAFKGYYSSFSSKPYPTALCISINNEVVHAPALPSRILKDGDLVSIDVGMQYPSGGGYFTDMAATFAVGKMTREARRLLDITKKALKLAIKTVKPGAKLGDVGRAVEDYVLANGFSVVRDLVGHGIGRSLHEEPNVPNYAIDQRIDVVLKPGMTLAIEPMVNAGDYQVYTAPDDITIKTTDGSLSAHFEHTVAVTRRGHKVLTE